MAKRTRLRLPVTIAWSDSDSTEHRARDEQKHIAANALQSSNVNFGKWNRSTLLNRLAAGSERFVGIIYVETKLCDGELLVALETGDKLTLLDLIAAIESSRNLSLLFVGVPVPVSQLPVAIRNLACRSAFFAFELKDAKWPYAVALEATNLAAISTMDEEHGTYGLLFGFVKTAITLGANILDFQFYCQSPQEDDQKISIWQSTSTSKLNHGAEIQLIRQNARKEQLDDVVKELLDAASVPRAPHLPSETRLISTQGLFWLTQVSQLVDFPNWIAATTLFNEVFPNFTIAKPRSSYVKRPSPKSTLLDKLFDQLILIESGTFRFGRTQDTIASEPPANEIYGSVDEFWISKFPVTEEMWLAVFEGDFEKGARRPKTNVNYFEAKMFCEALTEILSNKRDLDSTDKFRVVLPTEYEWEAAAAGAAGYNFPWGDIFLPGHCNADMEIGQTTDVDHFAELACSPFGVCDMSGNVREWTSSYGGSRGTDWQWHSIERIQKQYDQCAAIWRMVIRGGSYSFNSQCTQTWVRNTQIAKRRDEQTGFRVALKKV